MNNYEIAQERAREHFLTYDRRRFLTIPGVREEQGTLCFRFLGADTCLSLKTGHMTFSFDDFQSQWSANYSEAMSIYDWLCDRKDGAKACGQYCPVSSLSGLYVSSSGSGLKLHGGRLPERIDQNPEGFRNLCLALGAETVSIGDLGFRMPVFPDLNMMMTFFHGEEDLPPVLNLLWDLNTLDFVRYETVYFIAGVLLDRLNRF